MIEEPVAWTFAFDRDAMEHVSEYRFPCGATVEVREDAWEAWEAGTR